MRYIYQGVAKDGNGKVLQSATVSVYLAGTVTAANVYAAESGGSSVNSVLTDSSDGSFLFWVDSTEYSSDTRFKISISKTNFRTKSFDNLYIIRDVDDFYYPVSTTADQGVVGESNTIKYYIDLADGDTRKIILRNNSGDDTTTYTFITDETIPSNITLEKEPGAILDGVSGGSTEILTINCGLNFGLDKGFGDNLTVEGSYYYNDMPVVKTIPELRLVGGNINQVIRLNSHSSVGDNGGDDFYFDPASVLPDNGFDVIKVTSILTGRWIRLNAGVINLSAIGAKTDGTDIVAVLSTFITSIGSDLITIKMTEGTFSALSAITTPENVSFDIDNGAEFQIDAVEFVMGGPVIAGPYKIFDEINGGKVLFEKSATEYRWTNTLAGPCYPDWWGAGGIFGDGDDTIEVQAAFETQRPVLFARHYPVTQVSLTGNEMQIDFNNFALVGIATSATNSVLQIKGGFSVLRDLRVDANYNLNYKCGIQWYTNNLNLYYPGRNRMYGMYVFGALVGLNIGAFRDQGSSEIDPMPAQGTVQAEGIATNAPLSESFITGFQAVNCVQGIYARQSNGKITLVAPDISGSNATWGGTEDATLTSALRVAASTEITILGGDIEQIHEATGDFIHTLDNAHVIINGSTLESVQSIRLEGDSRIEIEHLQNWGLNATLPAFQVLDSATGYLWLANTFLFGRAGAFGGTTPLVQSVSSFSTSSFSPNFNFMVDAVNVEFRDWAFTSSVSYRPMALGVRMRNKNCYLTSYTAGSRTLLYYLDDGADVLSGIIDTPSATITAYPQTAGAASGGWTFSVGSVNNSWGLETASLPTVLGEAVSGAIRLKSFTGEICKATSAKAPVLPSHNYTITGYIGQGLTSSNGIVQVFYYKFDGSASSTASENVLVTAVTAVPSWQPLQLRFSTPSDCTQIAIVLYTDNNAEIQFANIKVY